jgi:uncharacterized protein (TIGR02118 family)
VYKLIILFNQPADPEAFEQRWSEEFVPLAERLPGLQRVVVSHTAGGPAGPVPIYLIHELHFSGMNALTRAMTSPEGVAAGQCLVRLAGSSATLLFAEHMEDAPGSTDGPEEGEDGTDRMAAGG